MGTAQQFNAPMTTDAHQINHDPQKRADAVHASNWVLVERVLVPPLSRNFLNELNDDQTQRATERTPGILELAQIDPFEAKEKYAVADTGGFFGSQMFDRFGASHDKPEAVITNPFA
jgi:hypothetical protein